MTEPAQDWSSGWDAVASRCAVARSCIGATSVERWARTLPTGAPVLDVACGTGAPITERLIAAGLDVYAIDASPTMVSMFRARCPAVPVACEPVEQSRFFDRTFDGAVAWGLLFLLTEDVQRLAIARIAGALVVGGRFLFTSPAQPLEWLDASTRRPSRSLGAAAYQSILASAGLTVVDEFDDEGDNHYYDAVRV